MKKMIIFGVSLLVLFGLLAYVVNYQNQQASEDNPYGKSNLEQATIEQLDDPLYQNQVQPDDLKEMIDSGEEVTVYFYSPTCSHCVNTTPIVVPMAKELGVDMKKLNVLEFESGWNTFNIKGTPTIVHYENGEETARIVGEQPEAKFDQFFNEEVLD